MQCSVPLKSRITQKNCLRIKQTSIQRRNRGSYVCKNGFLDFLGGAKTKSGATEIVDQIIELTRPTYGGIFVGQKRRQQIAELVDQLVEYRGRAPTRSSDFWGLFELVYSETPFDIAGPFRTPPALVILQGQRLYSNVDKSSKTITNYNFFKPLGIFKGFTKFMGDVEVLSGDQFRFNFSHLNFSLGGGVNSREQELELIFEMVYTDDRLRIVTVAGEDDLTIFERVDPQQTGLSLDCFTYEEFQQSGKQQEIAEVEEEQEKKPSFLSFAQNGRMMGSGTVSISNLKSAPSSGTVRLAQAESSPMDQVRQTVQMYQQQVKDAKQAKKELSQNLKDLQSQQLDLAKQSEKIQQQAARTEVELENIQQMLQQISDEENQNLQQLKILQNKLDQLKTPSA